MTTTGLNPENSPIQPSSESDPEGIDKVKVDPHMLDTIEENAQALPDTHMQLEPLRRGYGVSTRGILKLCRLAEVEIIHAGKEGRHELAVRSRQVLKLTHVLELYEKVRPKHKEGQDGKDEL